MLISWKQKGVSGDFATTSNWDPATIPGPADDAIIGARGTYTVTSSVDETVNSLAITNKHATLFIGGGSSFSDTFGGVNDGTIVVDSSSSMFIGTNTANTTLSNVGTIDLENSSLLIGLPGVSTSLTVSVTGGGHIDLSGGRIGPSNDSDVDLVTDNTISGTGSINFSVGGQEAGGHWTNQGIVDASTPNGTLVIGNTHIENSNILEATNGGLLRFVIAPLDNAAQGIVEAKGGNSEVIIGNDLASGPDTNAGLMAAVDSGTLLFQDAPRLDNTLGTIEAGHGSTIGLEEDNSIVGGSVTVMRGGVFEAELSGASTVTGALVTNAGTVGAEGANLTIIGDVTNTGTLDANNATLVIDGAVSGGKATLEGTGEIEFGAASAADVTFAANSTAILKLDNSFSGTVSGLTTGDYIDLSNINFADKPTLSFVFKTHVLTVTDTVSDVTDTITFKGAIGSFSAQSDGNGGTFITDPPVKVSHDSFVFAANLGDNGSKPSDAPMHHEPIDPSHPGGDFADLALMGQAHANDVHLTAAPDAIDGHHAAALAAHHFLV
jgi:hypothetical protein